MQQSNPWDPPSNSESSDEDLMIIEAVPPHTKEDGNVKTAKDRAVAQKKQPIPKYDSNSEEDDVIILDADSISCKLARHIIKFNVQLEATHGNERDYSFHFFYIL